MALVKVLSWVLFHRNDPAYHRPVWSEFLSGFSIFAFGSVAFAFYLRYVGKVPISFQLMIKVLFLCMAAPVVLRFYDAINLLKLSNTVLTREKKTLQKQLERLDGAYYTQSVELFSENKTESIKLLVSEVAFIRSADNYVEIVYIEDGVFRKKLIRNTLKEMEIQVRAYPNFVRCHRVCIVNTVFIEKLNKGQDNHWITIRGYEEKIPVSRQNVLRLKEME